MTDDPNSPPAVNGTPNRPRPVTPYSESHYETLVYELCCMPPGQLREQFVRDLVRCLVILYSTYGLLPPPGLGACARRMNHLADG